MTALDAPRSSWPLLSDAASSFAPSLAETAPPSPRAPTGPPISAPRPRRVQLVAPVLEQRPQSQAASDAGVDPSPRRTVATSAEARARLSPNTQDDLSTYSVSPSNVGIALSPSPMRWTSSSGASSLGPVVYDDWPVPSTSVPRLLFSPPPKETQETVEAAPVPPRAVVPPADDDNPARREKRWSQYTRENVERLREAEDGALLVWLALPSMSDDLFRPTPRPSVKQSSRSKRPRGFYLTPPSRQTPLTSPISLASNPIVEAQDAENDYTFLPTSPVRRDLTPTPVETDCSFLHVLPWRRRRASSARSSLANSQIAAAQPPSDPAHLSISRATLPGFLALLGRSPPVPEFELVARPSPTFTNVDDEKMPIGPQGYKRVVVPRPDVKPGRLTVDLPRPPRPPSPPRRHPTLGLRQSEASPEPDTTPEPAEARGKRTKGKGRAVGWALG